MKINIFSRYNLLALDSSEFSDDHVDNYYLKIRVCKIL